MGGQDVLVDQLLNVLLGPLLLVLRLCLRVEVFSNEEGNGSRGANLSLKQLLEELVVLLQARSPRVLLVAVSRGARYTASTMFGFLE